MTSPRAGMTKAEAQRSLVQSMDAEGLSAEEIAKRVGITEDRVEQILDAVDGRPHPDDEHRAPAVEPLPPEKPKVIPSAPPKLVEVTSAPWPEVEVPEYASPDPTTFRKSWMGPVDASPPAALLTPSQPVLNEEQRAELVEHLAAVPEPIPAPPPVKRRRLRGAEIKCGSLSGYFKHRRVPEKACRECLDAYNEHNRLTKEAKKKGEPQPTPAARELAPHGTPAAYKRHMRAKEPACEPCSEAQKESMREYRDRPQFNAPDGAVAFVAFPIDFTALAVLSNGFAEAFGDDLRVVGAPGGMWVIGQAS